MKEIREELVKKGFYEIKGKDVWNDYTYLWEFSGGERDAKYEACIVSQSNYNFVFETACIGTETGHEGYRNIVFRGNFNTVKELDILLKTTSIQSIMNKGKNKLI
jgi:hypothetical protein